MCGMLRYVHCKVRVCLSWDNSLVNSSVSPFSLGLGSLTNRTLTNHSRSHLNKHNRQHRVQDHHAALSVYTLQMEIHQLLNLYLDMDMFKYNPLNVRRLQAESILHCDRSTNLLLLTTSYTVAPNWSTQAFR